MFHGQTECRTEKCTDNARLSNIADIYYARGYAYNEMNNLDAALSDFLKARELSISENPDLLNEIGVVCLKQQNYDEAIEYLIKILKINPDYYLAYYNLGIAYKELGDYEQSILNLRKALEIEPDYEPAVNYLDEVLRLIEESDTE